LLRVLVYWPGGENVNSATLIQEAKRLRKIAFGPEPDWETMDPDDERWDWHNRHFWEGKRGPCSVICVTTGRQCETTAFHEYGGLRFCLTHHPLEIAKRKQRKKHSQVRRTGARSAKKP
jgi:hypothetical protein